MIKASKALLYFPHFPFCIGKSGVTMSRSNPLKHFCLLAHVVCLALPRWFRHISCFFFAEASSKSLTDLSYSKAYSLQLRVFFAPLTVYRRAQIRLHESLGQNAVSGVRTVLWLHNLANHMVRTAFVRPRGYPPWSRFHQCQLYHNLLPFGPTCGFFWLLVVICPLKPPLTPSLPRGATIRITSRGGINLL